MKQRLRPCESSWGEPVAIARMLKVSIIGHMGELDTVVVLTQRAGAVEVLSQELEADELSAVSPDPERMERLETEIADASFTRDFLRRFRTSDAPMSTFVSEKIHVSREEFEAFEFDSDFEGLYRECESISDRLAHIERERGRLHALIHDLAPWHDLKLQISQWKGTERVALFTGTVPASASENVRQALRDAVDLVSVKEVGRAGDSEAWIVMAHRSVLDDVRATLSLTEFTEVSFPGLEDYPAEESAMAEEALEQLAVEEEELVARAEELAAEHYVRTAALVQALLTRRDAEEVRAEMAASERVFLVTGWVPQDRQEELVSALAPVAESIDLTFEDPGPEDRVPVELKNPPLLRPFEVLTDLYGRPRYGDLDPTPFVAGFFFLFFGMCIGDVGYGFMLLVAAWLIKNRLDVAPGVKKFMDLLILGGISSMIVGVATRSYFALAEESLPQFLRYTPLIEPLDQVMTLLVISVALGVVHVSLGVCLKAYRRIRDGDVIGALFEDLSTLVLFVVIGVVVAMPDTVGWLLPWSFGIAILLKGRIIEELVLRRSIVGALIGVGKGLLGLYGLVGYASNFLSYTRLAALGLASLLVGDVMNRLAELVSGVPLGVGLLSAALILIVGHTFNVAINLLGAFVHPTRLQFVEFFSEFYEAGGRRFTPLAPRTKSVVLHSDTGEQKGGART